MKALSTIAVAILSAQISFARPADNPLSAKAVSGYWKFEHSEGSMQISTVTSYLPNGIYTDEGTISAGTGANRREISLTLLGRWTMEGNELVITISDSSAPMIYKKGMVVRSTVISVDDSTMIFMSEADGKRYTAKRLARNPNNPEN